MAGFVEQAIKQLEVALQDPLARPVLISLAAVLLAVLLLAAYAKEKVEQPKEEAGTVIVDGVRRSTRWGQLAGGV